MIRMTIQDNIHTFILGLMVVAGMIVRAFDPGAVSEETLILLIGGTLGTAGTKAPRTGA